MGGRLKNFPVPFFSVVMGIAGATIASQRVEASLQTGAVVSGVLLLLSVTVFALILCLYTVKMMLYTDEVKKEFRDPVRINFFPTVSISLLLLAVAFSPLHPRVGATLALTGAILQFFFFLVIVAEWIRHERFEIKHMNPSWFIPAVGNLLISIACTGITPAIVSWFFFSAGIFFWLVLQVILFSRIIFNAPLPEKLVPTFFILIAPPAVGFLAYFKLTGVVDNFATFLFCVALLMFFLLLSLGRMFFQIRFFISWWAYSFPLAALTMASLAYHHHGGGEVPLYFGLGLFLLLALLILFLIIRTLIAILRHEICVEE
ncbi:MAG: SLAC1 anion channel family protein [Deltaproteobacteria bacterium]|nr:SLAC1 anion channel family protein [Deltaproteobacteria bacterium]